MKIVIEIKSDLTETMVRRTLLQLNKEIRNGIDLDGLPTVRMGSPWVTFGVTEILGHVEPVAGAWDLIPLEGT